MTAITLCSDSPEQTEALGRRLGALLAPGDVVGLVGELGAGKTCFVRGVAEGAGVPPAVYVSSPTFTLVNEYPGQSVTLAHIDLYRIDEPEDLVEVGIVDACGGDGACLVEWYDRFADELGVPALEVTFRVTGESARELDLRGSNPRHEELARALAAAGEAPLSKGATR